MNQERKQAIINTIQILHNWIGDTVVVDDWICTSGRSYDRHQTMYSRFVLKIEEIMVRISGSIATMGNNDQYLEFRTDSIKHVEILDEIIIIEIQMQDTVWRKLKFSKISPTH